MRITMLATCRGSEDGFVLRGFWQGKTYDLADTLARYFIRCGYAIISKGEDYVSTV